MCTPQPAACRLAMTSRIACHGPRGRPWTSYSPMAGAISQRVAAKLRHRSLQTERASSCWSLTLSIGGTCTPCATPPKSLLAVVLARGSSTRRLVDVSPRGLAADCDTFGSIDAKRGKAASRLESSTEPLFCQRRITRWYSVIKAWTGRRPGGGDHTPIRAHCRSATLPRCRGVWRTN